MDIFLACCIASFQPMPWKSKASFMQRVVQQQCLSFLGTITRFWTWDPGAKPGYFYWPIPVNLKNLSDSYLFHLKKRGQDIAGEERWQFDFSAITSSWNSIKIVSCLASVMVFFHKKVFWLVFLVNVTSPTILLYPPWHARGMSWQEYPNQRRSSGTKNLH
jgi:hypothetical protein